MNIFSLKKRLSTAANDHSSEAGPRGLRLTGAANANAASASASANESKYSSKPEQAEGVLKMADVIWHTQVAVGYQDGNVKIFNSESCELMNILTSEEIARDKYPVMCVRFVAPKSDQDKHMLVATYTTGHVRFWNYPEQTCVNIVDEMRPGKQTFAVAINSSGDSFATVGSDNQIYVYGTFSMRKVRTLQHSGDMKTMTGHVDRVYAIHFHPQNPNIFLTGGWDNTVHFWDARNRSSFRRIFGPHICGDALELDITGNNIVTGSWRKEKTLQIWDFGTGDLIKNVPDDYGGGSALYCAQWLGKEYVCCGGCNRNRTRVCDRKNYSTVGLLGDLPQGVYCLDNDRSTRGPPQLCIGAARKVYLLKIQTQSQQ